VCVCERERGARTKQETKHRKTNEESKREEREREREHVGHTRAHTDGRVEYRHWHTRVQTVMSENRTQRGAERRENKRAE